MNRMVQDELCHKEWFAVYTKSNHEKMVNSQLLNKDIESYLPLRNITSQWKDRKKLVQIPLFPGYLFVNTSPNSLSSVFNTKSVVSVLGDHTKPISIPDEQIESIKKLLDSDLVYDPYPYLIIGKEVEIINGPLTGTTGKVVERNGTYKVIISIDMLKRSVAVEIGIEDVKLL